MPGQPRIRAALVAALLIASALALADRRVDDPGGSTMPPVRGGLVDAPSAFARPGDPLPGLTESELAAYDAGQDEFVRIRTPESGLGPIFNAAGCVQCHGTPAPGGSSAMRITRFGRVVNGFFVSLGEKGGSMLQRFAIDPGALEVIPPEANAITERLTTPLFGAGLIDAIPDGAILANEARAKAYGIRGRAAWVTDDVSGKRRVGRFGWKAQQASLLAFVAAAYVNEMGITNRIFPEENAPNGDPARLAAFDHVADPEDAVDPVTGRGAVDRLADFVRLLAPPSPAPGTASSAAGAAIFAAVGCAECHQPTMPTGASATPALAHRTAALYSDLLLHDMGPLADGIVQADARMREMRTAPLWGLRMRHPFLHDGRAPTLDAAIRAHDGEAAIVRDRYLALPPEERGQLHDFLQTL